MKKQRFLAALLSVALLAGAFTFLLPAASAAEAEELLHPLPPMGDYMQATELALNQRVYESAQEYLDNFMELRVSSGAYQLYANPFTGEVALKNRVTGQILSTNPYRFGEKAEKGEVQEFGISESNRQKLLSQILINYTDETGAAQSMNSFNEAAGYGQINIRDIKNGLRVEYIIGRLDTTYLLPGYIMADRFESEILDPVRQVMFEQLKALGAPDYADPEVAKDYANVDEYFNDMINEKEYEESAYQYSWFAYFQLKGSYALQDPNANISPAAVKSMQEQYPITAEKGEDGRYHAIYTLSVETDRPKSKLEGYVKQYCTEYGYDDLEADHEATMYEAEESDRPVFRLSLEYVLDEDGMTVRLPAGALRYDETLVTLKSISVNPYFGAVDMNDNDGYLFFPDGTGSLMEYRDLYNDYVKKNQSPAADIYGKDYAYYDIQGSQHQESVRMPVYGLIDAPATAENSMASGYLAIITEGDAMTEIVGEFGGPEHHFASAFSQVIPRPTDEYTLDNALSATGSGEEKWTVVSERRYTGNYTTKIVMLTDSKAGDQAILDGSMDHYYRADWVGMAKAYRDFLEKTGVIDRLTEAEVKDDLPLYIESFGSIETTEKFLSMPITVDVALTSFADISTMYNDLSKLGITNINFRLVGFANGGMASRYPVKLDWEDAVGGDDGFEKLLKDAKAKGYGVYPDFDFLYISETGWFDGISTKKAAVRTVDDRYASKQIYDAVYQDFFSYFEICVASSQLEDFYDTFAKQYGEFKDAVGLSLALFGDNLNSNFDEDDPTTRADAKEHYVSVLKKAAEKYSLMSDGGNIFAASYVDHMLNAPLESSNFNYASHTVPFYGMVMHGYMNMAGSAFNEAGDVSYNIMRSIENGMAPYYILSYNKDATSLLKQDEELSKYYSIRYDIWLSEGDETKAEETTPGNDKFVPGELIKQYALLNSAIGDLQTALITDHQFLIAERVRTDEEIVADRAAMIQSITDSVITTAYNMEATRIRLFRREANIFDRIQELNDGIEELTLTASEEARIISRVLQATHNSVVIKDVTVEDMDDITFDTAVAKVARNAEALKQAYKSMYIAEADVKKYAEAMDLLDALYNRLFTDAMYDYFVNVEFKDEVNGVALIGQQAEVEAEMIRFVQACHNTYFNLEGEKVDDLAVDIMRAGVILRSDKEDLNKDLLIKKLYNQLYYPADREYTDEEIASRVKEREAVSQYADEYLRKVITNYIARYASGDVIELGKTVAVQVDTDAVVAQLMTLVGDSLTADQVRAAVVAANCEKSNSATDDQTPVVVKSVDLIYRVVTTDSLSTESEKTYAFTSYSLADGRVSMVTYTRDHGDDIVANDENVRFALNYNLFDVEIRYLADSDITVSFFDGEGKTTTKTYQAGEVATLVVPSYGFVRID